MHITLIEQDQYIASSLMEYLLNEGHTLSTAKNLDQALIVIGNKKTNVLLMDPSIDKMAHILFRLVKRENTKTIMMSTNPKLKGLIQTDYFLTKPFDIIELEYILNEVQENLQYSENNP